MDIFQICQLIAGLGAFLIGVKLLSDNIEKLSTKRLRALFAKSSKNKLVGVGVGTITTAVVQSSSLTSVMVVGLVNAGVMSLLQATAVMMGANIGTTITAQIAALQSFSFSKIAVALAGIGMFITIFAKKDKVKYIGDAIAGLGLVFVGMTFMSESMADVNSSPQLVSLFASINNPFVLVVVGMLITAIVQSSSAVTSIVISMVGTGIVIGNGGNAPLFIILGTNIGTCVTALLSSIGATTNGKRASLIHLLFNTFGTVIFFVLLSLWPTFNDNVLAPLFSQPATQIAMFHTLFNVVCTAIFLPMSSIFVKLATLMIKDKQVVRVQTLDTRLLATPTVAISVAKDEAVTLLNRSNSILHIAFDAFVAVNAADNDTILQQVQHLENDAQQLSDYLVQISSCDIVHQDEVKVTQLHHNIGDIVRIAELASNITKYTTCANQDHLTFSQVVLDELAHMIGLIDKLHNIASQSLATDNSNMNQADVLENQIDDLRKVLINDHIKRLNEGACKVENSRVFFNLVSNLERVGDHLNMIVLEIDKVTTAHIADKPTQKAS